MVDRLESKDPSPAALLKVATALEAVKRNRDDSDPDHPSKEKGKGTA